MKTCVLADNQHNYQAENQIYNETKLAVFIKEENFQANAWFLHQIVTFCLLLFHSISWHLLQISYS